MSHRATGKSNLYKCIYVTILSIVEWSEEYCLWDRETLHVLTDIKIIIIVFGLSGMCDTTQEVVGTHTRTHACTH